MIPNHENQLKLVLEELCDPSLLNIPKQQLTQLLNDHVVDKCLGCLFGAFIGDALGSYCEFEGVQSQSKMKQAMEMPGGGIFKLQPGQLTDDSEMALHMLAGLQLYNPNFPLSQQISYIQYGIAQQYISWLQTDPFDIGITCKSAIQILQFCLSAKKLQKYLPEHNSAQLGQEIAIATSQIYTQNLKSLSNGFLMKITPMACFHALLTKYQKQETSSLKMLVQSEAKLTHGNVLTTQSAVQWVQMLSSIILSQPNSQTQQLQQLQKIFDQFYKKNNTNSDTSLKNQIFRSLEYNQKIQATQRIGYFKHAYHFAMYQMKAIENALHNITNINSSINSNSSINININSNININKTQTMQKLQFNSQYYKRTMKFVIQHGGDTDTNACIVGGFIGAILGFKRLPPDYLTKQLNLKFSPDYRKNHGSFYEPRRGFIAMINLIRTLKK